MTQQNIKSAERGLQKYQEQIESGKQSLAEL